MKVFLDNEPLAVSPATVRAAIERAREAADAAGRLIVEVRGDGSPLGEGVLDDPPDSDHGLGELRMLSAAPGPFVRETLLETVGVLDQARAEQSLAAELIQGGKLGEALEPLGRVLELWGVVRDVVERSCALLGIDAGGVLVPEHDTTGAACIAELMARLTSLKLAIAQQDWGGVSDELAYEMDALAVRWRSLVGELALRVQRGA